MVSPPGPSTRSSEHRAAIAQAVFVTILWSTSWVLIKIGLRESLPALTFAGLRYMLAFVCLAPLVLADRRLRTELGGLSRSQWAELALLGVVFYTFTQGAQFLSLAYLPAAMAGLLLNLTPLVVGGLGILLLGEHPVGHQWLGVALCGAGVAFYFWPTALPEISTLGLVVATVGVLANATATVLGRRINRHAQLPALTVTFVSMGLGAALLLALGLATQGLGALAFRHWLLIAWLAVINTALAFTLWNYTLRTLSAIESSIINGLMLPQIALLAWFFLGESLSLREVNGLALVGIGTVLVQIRR